MTASKLIRDASCVDGNDWQFVCTFAEVGPDGRALMHMGYVFSGGA